MPNRSHAFTQSDCEQPPSAPTRHRVIQCSVGMTGRATLRGIIEHPDLELVGLWVHGEANEGVDAGVLSGNGAVGVTATRNFEEILSLDADCVCYMSTDLQRPTSEVVNEICRLLESGKNVIGTQASLAWPAMLGDDLTSRLAVACEIGNTSFSSTGLNPMGTQAILATLASMCLRVESTSICEMSNVEHYADPAFQAAFGFGAAPERVGAVNLRPMFEFFWAPALHLTAEWFGATIDNVEWEQESAIAEKAIDTPNGHIAAGTVSAASFRLKGMVNGRCRFTQAACYWVGDFPSAWVPPPGNGGYHLTVTGDPDMHVTWTKDPDDIWFGGTLGPPRTPQSEALIGALVATAARTVNSIPEICAAPAGICVVGAPPSVFPRILSSR